MNRETEGVLYSKTDGGINFHTYVSNGKKLNLIRNLDVMR